MNTTISEFEAKFGCRPANETVKLLVKAGGWRDSAGVHDVDTRFADYAVEVMHLQRAIRDAVRTVKSKRYFITEVVIDGESKSEADALAFAAPDDIYEAIEILLNEGRIEDADVEWLQNYSVDEVVKMYFS